MTKRLRRGHAEGLVGGGGTRESARREGAGVRLWAVGYSMALRTAAEAFASLPAAVSAQGPFAS